MSMQNRSYDQLIDKLDGFIRKFYKNQLIKGVIYTVALILTYFLSTLLIDFVGEFETTLRAVLFYTFLLVSLGTIVKFLMIPGAKLFNLGDTISHDEAAKIVGDHFSNIQDKLLNVLQLREQSATNHSDLVLAGIDQKASELAPVPFSSAINFGENKRYLKFALPPLFVFLLLIVVAPNIITRGTERLVRYNVEFQPIAPFEFIVSEQNLQAIKGEDFTVEVSIQGNELPNSVSFMMDGNAFKMKKLSKSTFSYTIKNVQQSFDFKFLASDFQSRTYSLNTVPQPILLGFVVEINYPEYTGKQDQNVNNIGDMTIPEGTEVSWELNTQDAERVKIIFSDSSYALDPISENKHQFISLLRKSKNYYIKSSNEFMSSKDSVLYAINVIPDQYPEIEVEERADSLSNKRIYFRGNISDDYGLTRLTFNYKLNSSNDSLTRKGMISENVRINKASQDNFFHYWDISNLPIEAGDKIDYYFEVWDNDGINGSKSTKSSVMTFAAPTLEELAEKADKSSEDIKEKMEESLKHAQEIQDELKQFQKKLMEKKELSWEDKKQLEELLEKQKQLEKNIEQAKNENQKTQQEQQEYQQQEERILEKQQQINELFEQVMTEEMKEMFRDLEEMMDKLNKEELQEKLEEMKMSNKDIEKELDRTLEAFKQLEFEQKLEETIEKLDELKEEQEKLAEQTESKEVTPEDLKEKQDELNEKFEELKEDMEKLSEKNDELEFSHDMPDTEQEQQEASEQMQQSSEELSKGKNKKSSQNQKNAAQKMDEMSQKMQQMQQEMAEQQSEDMDALRQLLENLIQLSFDQEAIMEELKTVKNHSPYFVELVQRQKKLADDAKMIEDTLFALSKRQPNIAPVVNREMTLINDNIDKSIDLLTNHQPPKRFNQYLTEAAGREQYVMTSLNNLALMLDEALQQMQQQMAQQQQGDKSCSKPGSNSQPKPGGMKQMQQSISQQMEQLKKEMEGQQKGEKPNGSQPGGSMSKHLAKLAAEQEALRNEIQKMAQKIGEDGQGEGGGKGNLEKLAEMMEENEKDIVNKNISQETIRRQRDIMTRLLEHEKAEREREYDEKRQSQEAKNQELSNPSDFFEYNMLKQKEAELLQTVPPTLNGFYKTKVNEYFNQVE